MLIIRNIFTAKPGKASQLAKQMKEVMSSRPGIKVRVLTDYIGKFNTVVMELEVNSFAEFENQYKEYMTSPEIKEKMKGYAELYLEGRREVLQVM
jgi:hypothetical protein